MTRPHQLPVNNSNKKHKGYSGFNKDFYQIVFLRNVVFFLIDLKVNVWFELRNLVLKILY